MMHAQKGNNHRYEWRPGAREKIIRTPSESSCALWCLDIQRRFIMLKEYYLIYQNDLKILSSF